MASTASYNAILPNKDDKNGFQVLLLDRQVAFMAVEVARVRDALLGSDVLIAKAEASQSLDMLESVVIKDPRESIKAEEMEKMFRYVERTALGDAAQRWAGHLPPVMAFAAEQPDYACTADMCPCGGGLNVMDIIELLRSQHQPDWSTFFEYAEGQRAGGRTPDETAEQLRGHLEGSLNKLNERFLKIVGDQIKQLGYPHQDLRAFRYVENLSSVLDEVKPLFSSASDSLSLGDTFNYSIDDLCKLHDHGRDVRESISLLALQLGQDRIKEAETVKLGSRNAKNALAGARLGWWFVVQNGDIHSIFGRVKTAQICLLFKEYQAVTFAGGHAVKETFELINEPREYTSFSSIFAAMFATGKLPEVPYEERRKRSEADWNKIIDQLYMVLSYFAEANRVLCHQALSGTGKLTEENLVEARRYRRQVDLANQMALGCTNRPREPVADVNALNDICSQRLKLHLQAYMEDDCSSDDASSHRRLSV